jgi:hypothetical protein
MTVKKLASLTAITVAIASSAAPAAMAETRPGSIAPAPTSTHGITCTQVWPGSTTYICQAKWKGGSSEWVCDTTTNICTKQ